MSQITTHVLDTALGKPGADIPIELQAQKDGIWETIGDGITNSDGRIADLLSKNDILKPNTYRMVFDTTTYFSKLKQKIFYPKVEIYFQVFDDSHYHIPLLLSPYGYSTYRGS